MNMNAYFVCKFTELTERVDVLEDLTPQLIDATSTQNERISSTEENILMLYQRVSSTETDVDGLDDRVEELESGSGNGTADGM